VLVPLLRERIEPALSRTVGFLPLFRGQPLGLGYLAAGLLLAIMILPTIATVAIDVLRSVPQSLREAGLALGATRWESIRLTVLPFAKRGIFGAVILGLARALGETMAVTMVIGNQPELHASLFSPGYTLPAVIANEFAEATGDVHIGALAGLALVLFAVTLALSAAARLLVRLSMNQLKGAA
jgi:phosphate transport system permease protein